MANTFNISVEIAKRGLTCKHIKEHFSFAACSLKDYANVLQSVQKDVNSALTEIVEQEKLNDTVTDEIMEDDEDDSDVDEIPNLTAKRKLTSHKNKKKHKQL